MEYMDFRMCPWAPLPFAEVFALSFNDSIG